MPQNSDPSWRVRRRLNSPEPPASPVKNPSFPLGREGGEVKPKAAALEESTSVGRMEAAMLSVCPANSSQSSHVQTQRRRRERGSLARQATGV
ncbi:MAG TPA: hypothetical protein VKK81_03835 [Candidatus Binatia bacterium]|nr:hypothetical protein [Candidatus Binatia bacterium]